MQILPDAHAREQPDSTSGFAPLKSPLFRSLWLASTVSNIGGWMQDTAGIWLMTALTSSPLPVALMQTAANLPVVILGLLSGSTADIFDRRRLLMVWQGWMLATVAVLSLLAFLGVISPWILLSLTFMMNVGAAMESSAWQAIVPELVPPEQLSNAVTLNSGGFNLARSLGPALGGILVAFFHNPQTGAGWVFVINTISFLGVVYALYRWKRTPTFKSALPAERLLGSMRAGLRYVEYSAPLKAVLLRVFIIGGSVSALWSLLSLVAARDLHRGALGYGIFTGTMGVGAVVGAIGLPRMRQLVAADTLLNLASLTFALVLLILAYIHLPFIVIPSLLIAGFAWVVTMSTLNLAMQLSAPDWVHARTLGVYQVVFSSGMALGSITWGTIAQHTSTTTALVLSCGSLLVSLPFAMRFHILHGKQPDFSESPISLATDVHTRNIHMTEGPVRIHVDYTVTQDKRDQLVDALYQLKEIRLRNGAIRWGIFEDVDDPRVLSETFIVESWLDYLRQQERFTTSDKAAEASIGVLCLGSPPSVSATIFVKQRTNRDTSPQV